MTPQRIQLRRTKGWRMPENTVKVTRPGPFGNPFRIGGWFKIGDIDPTRRMLRMSWCESYLPDANFTFIETNEIAVHMFKKLAATGYFTAANLEKLRGKNLACFCKIGAPCHADVLLEIANK